jgi:hypothetical protein
LVGRYNIVIENIKNPMLPSSSSGQFKIYSLFNDVVIDKNEAFGLLGFSNQSPDTTNLCKIKLNKIK